MQYLAEALHANTVRKREHLWSIVYLLFDFEHRHLLHSISDTITSERMERNISVMPYGGTWWEKKNLLPLFSIIVCYLSQALTRLDLGLSEIGDKGAQYLSEALQTNTVTEKESYWSNFCCCSLFFTDTYYTEHQQQLYWRERHTIFEWDITNKHSEREILLLIDVL